jgi:hypothetical protein
MPTSWTSAPLARGELSVARSTRDLFNTRPCCRRQLAPRGDRDPAAECDQRDADGGIDDVAEAIGRRDAGQPQYERCPDMSDAGLQSRAGGLSARPASLAREEGDRHPMIGHDRMQLDHHLHQAAAVLSDMLVEPATEIGRRLVTQPEPGHFQQR